MTSEAEKNNDSPSLTKLEDSSIFNNGDPQTSLQANGKLENINEHKIDEDLIKDDNNIGKKKNKISGILKKKVVISTITMKGKAKLAKKKDNISNTDSDNESVPTQDLPSLPKGVESPIVDNGDPQTSFQSNGKLENSNAYKIDEDLIKDDEHDNLSKKNKTKSGILKKKRAISTITMKGKAKLLKKNNNITNTDSDNESEFKQVNSLTPRKCSFDEKDENMVKKVTEIFQEVFKEERGNWGLKVEYYLSCLGVPIAFSGFWRFPQLLATYGGGAFLFCYGVMFLLIGIPVYFMEASIGQFCQLSVMHVWRCAPVMQGVGVAIILLTLITSVYNSQVVAYCVHYFFASFVKMDGTTSNTILWGECKSSWRNCYDVRSNHICSFRDRTEGDPNECIEDLIPSSRYYWQERVLRLREVGEIGWTGEIHWDLTLCVAFVWILTFVFVLKGVRSSGKVALFTGFIPICILISFLVFIIQKSGARTGLQEFYSPDWEQLARAEVWQKAAQQVIFSLCVTYGSILTFSSYKKFKTEVQVGAVLLTIGNIVLSVMAATCIFAMYGAMAYTIGIKDVKSLMDIEVSGIEIVFVFVPEVIARLFPYPHVWAVFFFLMLLSFGLHAQFSLVETVLTTVHDALPKLRRRKYLAASCLILPLFLLSIPLSSATGLHIHKLIGTSIVGPNVLLITFFEILALQCIYGVRRFSRDITFILKNEPSIYWKVCWIFVAPLTLIVLVIFALIDWERMLFEGRRPDKEWTLYLSWVLTLLPLSMIPFTFIFTLFYKLCVKEAIFQPSSCWGPGCPRTKERILEQRRLLREAKNRLDGMENDAFNQN